MIGLGTYKEEEDLASFLSQFEFIMREGEVDKKDWSVKLVTKLTPKLGEGVRPRLETRAVYEEIKSYLLNMVGATVAAYGHKLFAVTLDNIKKLDATHTRASTEHLLLPPCI